MKKRSKYRLYVGLMILSGIILAITLTMTSLRIILGGKSFTQVVLEENKTFLVNTLRFGHGVMAHMVAKNYESLIALALKGKFIRCLAILDAEGRVIAQSDPPNGLVLLKKYDPTQLKDGEIVEETKDIFLISYRSEEIAEDEKHGRHHAASAGRMGSMQVSPKPTWFL
ncbi:MAG: hypothetical protein V3W37_11630, partial [Candidatus Binatia bacterium]